MARRVLTYISVFGPQISLQLKRRVEILGQILDLVPQARSACEALTRGGWKAEPLLPAQMRLARDRWNSLHRFVEENSFFIPQSTMTQVRTILALLKRAYRQVEMAVRLGKDSALAHWAMSVAREIATRKAPTIEARIAQQIRSAIDPSSVATARLS